MEAGSGKGEGTASEDELDIARPEEYRDGGLANGSSVIQSVVVLTLRCAASPQSNIADLFYYPQLQQV